MTEDEWFERGEDLLAAWGNAVAVSVPGYRVTLTGHEESAFLYAWELAGREMGIVE